MHFLASTFALIAALFFLIDAATAQTAELATGEYPPFVTENGGQSGVISAIVFAALETQGIPTKLTFLPWNRGYRDTLMGLYAATFPYVKNQERLDSFVFSNPIFTDTIRMFGLKSTPRDVVWADRSICVPLGFNVERIQTFATSQKARLERPSSMDNCFQMLQLGRVLGVWSSETVAQEWLASHSDTPPVRPMQLSVDYEVDYFLMASKQLPDVNPWMARFNTGLSTIRKNGLYRKITAQKGPALLKP